MEPIHPQLKVTLSIGLAEGDGKGAIDDLVQTADERMYRAKSAGRNQVVA